MDGSLQILKILGKMCDELEEERGRTEEVREKEKNKGARVDGGFMYDDL